jgi:hypothetical protein
MNSFEMAGTAMIQRHEGNRVITEMMLDGLRSLTRRLGFGAPADDALTGASFLQQEPDLAKEAGIMPPGFAL